MVNVSFRRLPDSLLQVERQDYIKTAGYVLTQAGF